jgi:hypothetical protein
MSVPTGIGNYPPGVTDNDPHFDGEECPHKILWGGCCRDCGELIDEEAAAEAAYERMIDDGEIFRGGEAAAYNAEQQAWIQRNLK